MQTDTIYEQRRWSLDALFPAIESTEVRQAFDEIEAQVAAFEALRPRLDAMDDATFTAILRQYEALVRTLMRLNGYAYLRFAADTQDQHVQTFLARTQQLAADVNNRTLFFELWWQGLDDEQAERLMAAAGDYRYWLETLRLRTPYTLSEAEEKIIALKDVNGSSALTRLYDSITSRYLFKVEIDGEVKELTRGEVMVYVRDPDPELRAAAYQALFRVYEHDAPILGQIYQARVRDWHTEQVDLRGFETPIAVRNLANDVPDEVVRTLLDVCRRNAPLFQRYMQLKARRLGVERLRRYDLYAPIGASEKSYRYEEAVPVVLESLGEFDTQIAAMARRVFDENHLDGEVRKGKRTGAFCATIDPTLTPWVLQSFQGRPEDVVTMAHELGHAVHSLLAAHHTALTQRPSMPLAETASTFAQMLLVDYLLARESDPAVQRDLLFDQMDDAYATIMRQAFLAIFERDAHDLIHKGASVDELSRAYLENLQTQFGDALDLSDDFRHEWLAIPHFYQQPFYVYAYAFGQLLVLALYRQYLAEGDAFKPRYTEILAAGGSDSPIRILERAGLDVTSDEFWQGGFDVLEEWLDRLEALDGGV